MKVHSVSFVWPCAFSKRARIVPWQICQKKYYWKISSPNWSDLSITTDDHNYITLFLLLCFVPHLGLEPSLFLWLQLHVHLENLHLEVDLCSKCPHSQSGTVVTSYSAPKKWMGLRLKKTNERNPVMNFSRRYVQKFQNWKDLSNLCLSRSWLTSKSKSGANSSLLYDLGCYSISSSPFKLAKC